MVDTRNRFIFKKPDKNLESLKSRVISFAQNYGDVHVMEAVSVAPLPAVWKLLMTGCIKLNFAGR